MGFSILLEIEQHQDSSWILIGLSFLLIFITIFYLKFFRQSKKKGNTILITGISGSGKTVLFSLLREGKFRLTQTSMKENEDIFVPVSAPKQTLVHVVDIPGHKRLRSKLDEYLPTSRSLIFVIDSSNFENESQDVAELLFHILVNPSISKKKVPIQIVCNKSDIVTATTKDAIQSQLEKEIEKLRKIRKAFPTQNEENQEIVNIGEEGKPFEFKYLSNQINFMNCSLKEKEELSSIVKFICSSGN